MEDSEKLTALKKAYADIILNTAKEAAARIMVSERRAMMFHRELVSTKEDALRMLLRLKQMLDSKVSEAETTSSNQQKKIEELEAQLQEAEEIVRDLRAELREVQDELEKATINQMHPPVEQNIEGGNAPPEKSLQNRLDPYRSIYSVPDSQFESVATFDTRHSTVNGTKGSSMCCVSHDHISNCYIQNPDFASIVIRRKEPDLYKNGCTQRIRAFERSLFDENVSLPENVDDVRDETIVRGHEEGKVMFVTPNAKTDNISEVEKPDELQALNADADQVKVSSCRNKETKQKREALQSRLCSQRGMETNEPHDRPAEFEQPVTQNNTVEEEALVEVPICRKKRRFNKRKALQSRLHPDQVMETNKESNNFCTENSPHGFHTNYSSRENSSMVCEDKAYQDLRSGSPKEPTDKIAMTEQSGSQNDSEIAEMFLKACNSWNKIKDDKELLDKSDLTGQESLSTGSLEIPTCREEVEAANEHSDKLGLKESDLDEKASCQSANDRFIKYTFRRKRKKESLSSPDCSLEKSTLKEKIGENQNGHVEPQKSCTITESSRDSRRLAQVARQVSTITVFCTFEYTCLCLSIHACPL
ncbi:myosin-11 [Senna tora]|uniref:Myosin-11 n=1 Tax=Senna tora TaxID=362788 RepID=A0A834W203_9FABA|nr:myosin-11 [Senna tora]